MGNSSLAGWTFGSYPVGSGWVGSVIFLLSLLNFETNHQSEILHCLIFMLLEIIRRRVMNQGLFTRNINVLVTSGFYGN